MKQAMSEKLVETAFKTVLGRKADQDGLLHYTEEIVSGRMTYKNVLDALRQSSEFRARSVAVPAALKSVGQILAQTRSCKDRSMYQPKRAERATGDAAADETDTVQDPSADEQDPAIQLDARDAAMTLCTYLRDNINPDESKAVNTASGFILDVSDLPNRRSSSYVFVTAAHAAIPNPKLMFDKSYPFYVEADAESSRQPFGCTLTELWPFDYIVSGTFVDKADGKKRVRFIEGDLLGVDYETDTAVFELLIPEGRPFEPAGAVSATAPAEFTGLVQGETIQCYSDAMGMHSSFLSTGTVRLARFQYRAGRRPFLMTDLSLPAASSGGAIVVPGTPTLVGMHVASGSSEAMGSPYQASFEIPADIVMSTVSRILDAVNYTDSTGNVMIVVATNTKQLGMDGTVFTLLDMTRNLRLISAEGYLFADSLSFHGLEGMVIRNDIVRSVNGILLGAYKQHDQTSMYDVIAGLDDGATTVDVGVLRKRAGGWRENEEIVKNVPLTDSVGNWWTWWFAFNINSVTNQRMCAECDTQYIRDCVVRLQNKRFPSPDPEIFKYLTTSSLLGIQFASQQQSERLNAIVIEVTNFWVIHMRSTNAFKVVAQATAFDRVKTIIANQKNLDANTIQPTSLFEDLGFDSLDAVEMAMSVEDAFNIWIPDNVKDNLMSVNDVLNYLKTVNIM